jgi:putative redox protein
MDITVELAQVNDATSQAAIRQHAVLIDRPAAKDGYDAGPMGGELLLAALGGCFFSNLLAAVKARKAALSDLEVRVVGTLESAPGRFSRIRLEVTGQGDHALLEKLTTISERSCIVANTLRDGVALEIVVR